MGQNYGYETLMTELPTYMKQVLRFSIKEVSSATAVDFRREKKSAHTIHTLITLTESNAASLLLSLTLLTFVYQFIAISFNHQ